MNTTEHNTPDLHVESDVISDIDQRIPKSQKPKSKKSSTEDISTIFDTNLDVPTSIPVINTLPINKNISVRPSLPKPVTHRQSIPRIDVGQAKSTLMNSQKLMKKPQRINVPNKMYNVI